MTRWLMSWLTWLAGLAGLFLILTVVILVASFCDADVEAPGRFLGRG